MSETPEQRKAARIEGETDIKDLVAAVRELAASNQKLSTDVHTMKGNLAVNTSFTLELLNKQQVMQDGQQALHDRQTASEGNLTAIAASTAELVGLYEAGKKGVSFLQVLGRVLNKLARWVTPILVAGGAIYALWHGQPPEGPK